MVDIPRDSPTQVEPRPTRSQVMQELRKYAQNVLGGVNTPTTEQYLAYFAIAHRIPTPDFSSDFEKMRRDNTPEYQRIVRARRVQVLMTRKELFGY